MRMPGLDLLRIIAGLALIVCHGGYWLAPFQSSGHLWMLLGHMGVELFLVSSGFLLAEQALQATPHACHCAGLARTLLRLWPLYAVFLLCNLALLPADAARPPLARLPDPDPEPRLAAPAIFRRSMDRRCGGDARADRHGRLPHAAPARVRIGIAV